MLNLSAGDTRVFLFHAPNAAADPSGALDKVNSWLGKDRSTSAYPNLKVVDVTISPDGSGGVYTLIVVDLGAKAAPSTDL